MWIYERVLQHNHWRNYSEFSRFVCDSQFYARFVYMFRKLPWKPSLKRSFLPQTIDRLKQTPLGNGYHGCHKSNGVAFILFYFHVNGTEFDKK